MNSQDSRQALDYLLARIAELSIDPSVIAEIRRVSTLRVDDTSPIQASAVESRKNLRALKGEFESRRLRALTPEEVFSSSLEVIITRLREVPALAKRLGELLEKNPKNILWLPDAGASEYRAPQEEFTANDITLSNAEAQEI